MNDFNQHTQDVNVDRDMTMEVADILEQVYVALSKRI